MTRSFLRLVVLAFLGSWLLPLVTIASARFNAGPRVPPEFVVETLGWGIGIAFLACGFYWGLSRLAPRFDANALDQATFVDQFPSYLVDWGIAGAAGLSLLLELAVIRWQGTVFEFFAFYKNFSLMCCFAGLGLGYALAERDRLLLGWVVPLLCWQFFLLTGLRFGLAPQNLESLRVLPFTEQLNMGIGNARDLAQAVAPYCFLAVVFLLTVLAFLPVGQLAGRLMSRRANLRAYGLNLLGSLAGVVVMLLLSSLWTPPPVWFTIAFVGLLLFSSRELAASIVGLLSVGLALIVLVWPVSPLWQRIYSPYQLIEVGHNSRGLLMLRAAGHYYQQIHDLADSNGQIAGDPALKRIRDYYDLPYEIFGKPGRVAVVGAGTGNDVAAALRARADTIDAIEIDPAILMEGRANHPERPYEDPRVHAVVNDARSYLRTTRNTYDLMVYGLLDSHSLLSHASSVRLDSFVYTVQALREARARLRPGGVLSLSFSVGSDELGRKIYLMLQEAFDGRGPICLRAGYDWSVVFLESNGRDIGIPAEMLRETGFRDCTAAYANPALKADVSTDDWPFFYMTHRVYPLSYLTMGALLVSLWLIVSLGFVNERAGFSEVPFFLLGAGFMLIEAKGVTELALTFGNSWQVIGVVIAGILAMAFLANCLVQWLALRRPGIPYALLLLSLAAGWIVARGGGLPSTSIGRLGTAALLTCPILFAGMVFSTLMATRGRIAGIMAVNLLGAMVGGLLEYNSMYFGFRFLYVIAMGLYLLAWLWDLGPALHARAVRGTGAAARRPSDIGAQR